MSEWIEWSGGRCPAPEGTWIDIEYREAGIRRNVTALDWSGGLITMNNSEWDTREAYWRNDGEFHDIVRYRICDHERH